jgi:hypothetical protein
MTRAESAVFVVRGFRGADFTPALPDSSPFVDVQLEDWFVEWVVKLWDDGFTAGCQAAPLAYCPRQTHTVAEGAVFFLRMLHGPEYEPPPATGIFSDVPSGAWYARWVEEAYSRGILLPCQETPELKACPLAPLDRATAAYMMTKAKGIRLP